MEAVGVTNAAESARDEPGHDAVLSQRGSVDDGAAAAASASVEGFGDGEETARGGGGDGG